MATLTFITKFTFEFYVTLFTFLTMRLIVILNFALITLFTVIHLILFWITYLAFFTESKILQIF
jgi:hypothetical protein